MKKFILLILFCFVPFTNLGQTSTKPNSPSRKAAEQITAEQLKDYLHFVASDEMEGRDTPSRGLDLTAKFIALNLKKWGLKPAGDDNKYFQKIALNKESLIKEKMILEINGKNFKYDDDYLYLGGKDMVNAPLVFANHGWVIKSKGIDAYQGIDIKGKIVVLYSEGFPNFTITSLPKGITQSDLQGEKGVDWFDPPTYIKQKGAVGIILVASSQIQGRWERLKTLLENRPSTNPEKLRDEKNINVLPYMFVSEKVGNSIFENESSDKTSPNAFVINKTAKISVGKKEVKETTQNVVALWEGSDPILKNEMVAVGAHYDHIGINPNAPSEDKINNGADDDGSGTVALMAMAESLASSKVRPKRSILFVWHAGEEKGLWGSEYFNKFPTVDIKNVIAQLNLDMIGRSKKESDTEPRNKDLSGENEVYVIGSEMMSSKLGEVTKSVNDSAYKLNYNYKYDDPKDTNRFFFRSDHFNYAVNGIPIVFWFDGVHVDYHRVSDHANKIDYAKLEKITRTIFLTMWELGDLKERPTVDKQLPAELTRR